MFLLSAILFWLIAIGHFWTIALYKTRSSILWSVRIIIINKIKGKERSIYLSNKFKTELLQELQKEKNLSKLTPTSLDKHLKMIYSISHNNRKQNIISSIKLEI